MKKFSGHIAALALAAALSGPVLAEEPGAATVLATVGDVSITLGDLIVTRDGLPDQYKGLPDDVLFDGLLEQLIQQEALTQSLGGTLSARDQIALAGMRRNYLSNQALTAGIIDAVTEEKIQAAYDARFKDAAPAIEYHAAHILVDSEEKAKSLLVEVQSGKPFADVAKANSTDGSAAGGGDLGWFGLGAMVKPFEDAVVAAKIGEVAGPVQTQFGWHLILVTETRNATAPALEAVRDELAQDLQAQAVDDFVKSVTEAAKVTRAEVTLDKALIRDLTLLDK